MLPDTTTKKDPPQKKPLTMGFDIHFICILKCTLCFSAFLSNAPAPEGHLSPTSKTPAAWCHRKSQIQVPQKRTCLMRPSPLPSGWTISGSEVYIAPRHLKWQWTFTFCYTEINRYFRRTFFRIYGFVKIMPLKNTGWAMWISKRRSFHYAIKKIHYFHSYKLETYNSW